MSNNGSINDALDKAQRGLLDFFFPRKCPFCGRVAGRELLCEACKASLPRCDKVRTGTFGECAAPLYYEGRVRDALLAFKFKRRIEDLNAYGVLMAEKAAEVYADRFDAVTWVPVSKQRLKKRGFVRCGTTRPSPVSVTRRSAGPMCWALTSRWTRTPSPESASCSSTTSSPPAPRSPSASGC